MSRDQASNQPFLCNWFLISFQLRQLLFRIIVYILKHRSITSILIRKVAAWPEDQISPIAVFPCIEVQKNSKAAGSRPFHRLYSYVFVLFVVCVF